jgi:hypothetical protein
LAPAFAETDYRVAVVSTDLRTPGRSGAFLRAPAAPSPTLNCLDPVSGDPRAPDTADCQALVDAGGLPTLLGAGGVRPDAATLARQLRCLTTLGTAGDGFEMGLEAMRLALSCDGPNAAAFGPCCVGGRLDPACAPDPATDFLRPDAQLAVVFVGDEDDCSHPMANPAASRRPICRYGPGDADGDGVPDGYQDATLCPQGAAACFRAECGDVDAQDCFEAHCVVPRDDNGNCVWKRDALTPVGDYEDFLRGLGRRVSVTAFVGDRLFTEDGDEVAYIRGLPEPACDPQSEAFDPDRPLAECCAQGVCTGAARPVCEGTAGLAFSGRRYAELALRFGDAGCAPGRPGQASGPCTLCTDDAVATFTEGLKLTPPWTLRMCLDAAPACLAAGAGGTLATCATDDPARLALSIEVACARTVADGGGCRERLAPRRLGPGEWRIDRGAGDADCPSGVVLVTSAVPPGANVTVEYLVGPP